MKRILRPKKEVREKAEYLCDFTGKRLGDLAAAHVEIWCGYPSSRDGVTYHLHLSDNALDELMTYLRLRMLPHRLRDTGSHYLDGHRQKRVRGGPEDGMSKRQLLVAVKKQIE